MINLSLSQILVVILLVVLIFGDLSKIIKKLKTMFLKKNNRKKGI